jgi:hypothetical protein
MLIYSAVYEVADVFLLYSSALCYLKDQHHHLLHCENVNSEIVSEVILSQNISEASMRAGEQVLLSVTANCAE